jgi:MFS family permease
VTPAHAETPPSRTYANYVLGVLTLMYLFNYLDRWVLSILVVDVKEEFGVSDAWMGFLLGPAFAVFYTLLGLPIAKLADRYSRRLIISVAFVTWSLMTAVSGLSRSAAELTAARVGVGIGEAGGTAPTHALLADYFPPERRAFAFGIFQQGVYLGQLVGLVGGAAIATSLGWRMTFIVFGLAGIAGAALLYFTVREPQRGRFDPKPQQTQEPPAIREVFSYLWRRPSFRAISIGAGIASFGGTGFGSWMPTLLERTLEMSKTDIGLQYGSVTAVSASLGALAAGKITDVMSRRDSRWLMWVPAFSVISSLPFLIGQALAPTPNFALVMAVPSGLLGGGWAPAVYAAVQQLAPARMRAVGASIIVLFITLLGQGAGPFAIGLLNDAFESRFGVNAIRASMTLLLSTYLIAAVGLVWGARSLRRDIGDPEAER